MAPQRNLYACALLWTLARFTEPEPTTRTPRVCMLSMGAVCEQLIDGQKR